MTLKNRKMWIGVSAEEILGLLVGKYKMELPDDAEIVHVRSGEHFDLVEFLVRSEEFPELTQGMVIPMESKCLINNE